MRGSFDCPGCNTQIDIDEGVSTIPEHPRKQTKNAAVRRYGEYFPAPCVGIAKLSRPCKWSGAFISMEISR